MAFVLLLLLWANVYVLILVLVGYVSPREISYQKKKVSNQIKRVFNFFKGDEKHCLFFTQPN